MTTEALIDTFAWSGIMEGVMLAAIAVPILLAAALAFAEMKDVAHGKYDDDWY